MSEISLVPGLKLLKTFRGNQGIIHRISWSPDGKFLASPSRDNTIKVWSLHKSESVFILLGHPNWVNSVVWSPDSKLLASGDENGDIYLWNIKERKLIKVLKGHLIRIECLAWSPDRKYLGSASGDGTVIIWSMDHFKREQEINDHNRWVNAISWSKKGDYLATGAEDNSVKIWDSNFKLINNLKCDNWVTDLDWSPDGSQLANTSGSVIKIWDPLTGKLKFNVQGHEGRVKSVSYSFDGNLLASKSQDNTIRLWRTDTWEAIEIIEEPTIDEVNPESKIAFHPFKPILASLGENDTVIRIWKVSLNQLLKGRNYEPSIHFTNAKVVLMGENGKGKTCLAHALIGKPFIPQESTHGMNVYHFHTEKIRVSQGTELVREIMLWDLAGQSDYKLIHQLFLDETSLGIIVFDPADYIFPSQNNFPSEDIIYWNKVLNKYKTVKCPRILVAGRIDRGTLTLSQTNVQEVIEKLEISKYISTSAKTTEGIQKLKESIIEIVPWDDLPVTTSPILWNQIRDLILNLKEGEKTLINKSDLIDQFRSAYKDKQFNLKDFEIVLFHAQAQGLLWRFSFGDLILLKPELLNLYASSIILNARNHQEGLGSVDERKILDASIDFHGIPRIRSESLEKSLLYAVIELFLEKEIGYRIEQQIVFPSKFNINIPEKIDSQKNDLLFFFEGDIEIVYSTLLVRLFYSKVFKIKDIWNNGARFFDPLQNICGLILNSINGINGEISLFFDEKVNVEIKIIFSGFVHEHLEKHTKPGSLKRQRIYRCQLCNEEVEGYKAILNKIERGQTTITCQFCDTQIPLFDSLEVNYSKKEFSDEIHILNEEVDIIKSQAVGLTKTNAKLHVNEFDVFLAHNSRDKDSVLVINELLKKRGINAWVDIEQIPPGRWFIDILQEAIQKIKSAAIFIGIHGLGRWQEAELKTFISQCVENEIPVIPVLLPGVQNIPEELVFLKQLKCVKFDNQLEDDKILDNLEWGITGIKPNTKKKEKPQFAKP
jgi:small GTP-binding protein